LAVAQPLDLGFRRWAVDAAIPGEIIVRPVAVLFSVRFVVLAIEGNQVIQRKAIVAGDKIDALLCLAFFVLVYIRAPRQPEGHCMSGSVVAFEKPANVVLKSPVPFLPAIADEAPDLIEASGVPGFGNQLDIGEDGVGFDIPKNRWRRHWPAILVASEDQGEIKAKAVDMHLVHPIAEAVEDQPPDNRLVGVQGVAAAGIVGVTRFVFCQDVIGIVRFSASSISAMRKRLDASLAQFAGRRPKPSLM
jgi:hypothetical protein